MRVTRARRKRSNDGYAGLNGNRAAEDRCEHHGAVLGKCERAEAEVGSRP